MTNMTKSAGNNLLQQDPSTTPRRQAESGAAKTAHASPMENVEPQSPEAVRSMLHELRVHQIELEMQNEELRRTQAELDGERARYFDLYELAPVGYCTVSEQGLILQANLTAAQMLGINRGALIAKSISRFILKTDQDIYYLSRQQLIETGNPQTCELCMVRNDGTQLWVNLVSTYRPDNGGTPLQRMALTDITSSKTMATALQEKNVELESARAVAEKANLAKSDFLSSMSHELRTPLSAILGFAQLIDAGAQAPTPSQKQSLTQIIKAGWYLLDLINEILDLAQIESGKLALALEPLALTALIQECLAMVEPQAQQRGIRISFAKDDHRHFIQADRMRVKQALINLLSNAIKYNQPNGAVRVDCSEHTPGRLRIAVQDTGAGLPAEKLAQLFQPFNRLGQNASTAQGTGIGLVVCKRLVELMGGSIGVASTVGTGSTFWIELNRAVELLPEPPATSVQAVPSNAPVHALLYIEDNPANLMLVEDLIARRPDLRFLSAVDATHGIELARSAQPDVILMDINLPGISGLQALRILAHDPVTAHIPVVALSAHALPHDVANGLAAGFFRYLTKPLKVDVLMDTLDVALKFSSTTVTEVKTA